VNFRRKTFAIIFGTGTPAGKAFDVALLYMIILSVLVVTMESVSSFRALIPDFFTNVEWFFTIIFTIEYILRIITSPKRSHYIFSFYGVVDLLAILPTYVSIFLVGSQYLIVIRIIRLLRIFRVLKLSRYIGASGFLWKSIINSRHKIFVFLWLVLIIVVVVGAVMYLVEGPENGFRSIPESIYWAIVTLTTVGYGDISPHTALGKTIASLLMITGYAIIAVPTGIISVEMTKVKLDQRPENECPECQCSDHDEDAKYCKGCGRKLD